MPVPGLFLVAMLVSGKGAYSYNAVELYHDLAVKIITMSIFVCEVSSLPLIYANIDINA